MKHRRIPFFVACMLLLCAGLSVAASLPTPKILVNPVSAKFGSVKLGESAAPQSITIGNSGTSDLIISGISITGADDDEFNQTSQCGTIAPGKSCLVGVTFTPGLPYANKAAVLAIASNDPKKRVLNVGLSGQVAPPPKISATPESINFGEVLLGSQAESKTVIVKNSGVSDLIIAKVGISGVNPGDFSADSHCTVIPNGGSCTIDVKFAPTAVAAMRGATLDIASNDPWKPILNVKLSGHVPPPKISATPQSINFGKLPEGTVTATKTVTVKNTGRSNLIIASVGVSGVNPGDFNAFSHCNVISNGDSCTIDVEFAPSVAAAKRDAILNISSNDPDKKILSLKLSGQAPPVLPSKTAEVSKFGKGVVVDNTGAINCGSACSSQYVEGTAITFTATPAEGWQFHHWTGCDMVQGNACTVTMNSDKTVYPTFSAPVKTKRNVIQLDDATMALLKNQAGTTYIFDISATAIAALKPGDVILSLTGNEGNGLARKVKSVSILSGTSILVDTENASLQDILLDGTVIVNQRLTYSELKKAEPLLKGARLVQKSGAAADIFTIEIDSDIGPLNISGSTTLTIEPDIAVSAGPFKGIEEFKSAMLITGSTELTLSSGESVPLIDKKIPLYKLYFSPIISGPVVLVPVVTVNLIVNGEAKVELSAGVSYTQIAAIGVHYQKSTGWKPIHDFTKNVTVQEPTLEGSINLKGAVALNTEILLYGVVGPYVNLESYLKAEASEKVTASKTCVEWGLFLGVGANAGAKIGILGYDLAEFDAQLFDFSWPIKEGSSGGCDDNEPPSNPQDLNAVAISSTEIQLTWVAPSDDNIVKGYNIKRDNARHGSSASNFFNDLRLLPNTTYCYSVTAFDQDNNASGSSSTSCATTKKIDDTESPTSPMNLSATAASSTAINLRWSASTDDTKVAGYIVYRNALPVETVKGLASNDLGLKQATKYCYNVSAFDEAGNESTLSNEVCATTNTTGAWNVFLACQGQAYNLQNNLDLDESITSNIQVTGTGFDYPGTPLAYTIYGLYDSSSKLLDGSIAMTFAGYPSVRIDTFKADLSTGDSGDTVMNLVQNGGCTAIIRFKKAEEGTQVPVQLIRNPSTASPAFSFQPK